MRLTPIGSIVQTLDFGSSSDTQQVALGTPLSASGSQPLDTATGVANWGMCELVYVRNVSTAVARGSVVTLDKNWSITAAASTASLGLPVYVALNDFTIGSTTTQYGWVMRSGVAPVTFSVAATVGAVYLGTAGNLTPTLAAGKQVLGAQTIIAAATAFTRSITTTNGSKLIRIAHDAGLFVGATLTGTGVSGTVASIDPSGQAFTASAAATASGTVTGTFTPTGYGIVVFNHPFSQGNIT